MSDILRSCADLPQRTFGPGEPLIEEGAEADLLFILIEGSVRVTKEGTEVARTDEPGAVFGEISALLGTPTSARVEVRSWSSSCPISSERARATAPCPGKASRCLCRWAIGSWT